MNQAINVETWHKTYSEGKSLLVYPDESVVTVLNSLRGKIKNGIDIGCGAGRHALLMAEYGIDAYGIDSSAAGIEFAKAQAQARGLTNAQFDCCQVQDITSDKKYDLIICWGVLHYLSEDAQLALRNWIKAHLADNGVFILTMRSIADSRYQPENKQTDNHYIVDYFKTETSTKQTLMQFWDQAGVEAFLADFKSIELGHRSIEPIGKLGLKTSHWLIKAQH